MSVLPSVAVGDIRALVGSTSYVRGSAYARQGNVLGVRWDPHSRTLTGSVLGGGGRQYSVTAYLAEMDGSWWSVAGGDCSCPVGVDCKHVAALVLVAMGAGHGKALNTAPKPPSWERALQPLLGSASAPGGTSLAIELTLNGAGPRAGSNGGGAAAARLLARLVRSGKRGGWVAGNLSWARLDALNAYGEEERFSEQHVGLARELRALYTASVASPYSYGYSYGDGKYLELSTIDSVQLWTLLEQCRSHGLRLVHTRKTLGDIGPVADAELCLDITGTASVELAPALRIGGEMADVLCVRFLGKQGHGVVYATRADTQRYADPSMWRIALARLDRPVPAPLQRLALSWQPLTIPAPEVAKFRDTYYPQLRHTATVISSDESFTPPAISEPHLTFRVTYGRDHEVDIRWEWFYTVGDTVHRTGPHDTAGGAGYRDLEAERALLATIEGPLADFGLRDADGQPALSARLTGIDTMRFSTELAPLLADQPNVSIDVDGEPADYRELSDSLIIGIAIDDIEEEPDWFDLGVTVSAEGKEIPFVQVFTALAADESHLLLDDGGYFSLDKPELVRLRTLIEEARALSDGVRERLTISRFQAGLFDDLTELGVVTRQSATWQRKVEGLLSIRSVATQQSPPGLDAALRSYQSDGYSWLALLWRHGLGGVLADDMGLGKTLQTLALICHAKQTGHATDPFLVVAPSSVVSNWTAEAARFAARLRVVTISDTLKRSKAKLGDLAAEADIVVTSYTLFRLDFDAHAAQSWSGLVLDEAQYVKNHHGKTYHCARRLTTPFKLAITGTPMENNLMELWALLSITAPGLFPNPTTFSDYYQRPIEKDRDADRLTQLRHRVKPLIKRRTKEQVAPELPAKQEQITEIPLHPKHRTLYQRQLQRERQRVLGLLDDLDRNRLTILRSLTVLRQMSLHAGLVDNAHDDIPCAKLDALREQLRDVIDGGHRALVFSQFTGFLAKVRTDLDAAGISYDYLDGKTRNRAKAIERFKSGTAPVFLISLKAGGFGLNLTEADYCFLLDPWWNPATESQAID